MIEILEPYNGENFIRYPVIINEKKHIFEIKYNTEILNNDIDGIVAMLAPIAICNRWRITSKLPIDKLLYDNLLNIPFVYRKFYNQNANQLGNLQKERISLKLDLPKIVRDSSYRKNITPISLGVDSMHTIDVNKKDLTHLIYINHFDTSTNIKIFPQLVELIALKYKKELIIAESNFLSVLNSLKLPGTNFHIFLSDAILFASCYPLGIKNLYFSGFGGDIPCLISQNSEVTQFFNSNVTKIVQNQTLRIKKLKYLAENTLAMTTLRVCNEDYISKNKGILNCSKCKKCSRTLVYLYMLGRINDATTFEKVDDNYLEYYLENHFQSKEYPRTVASTYYDKIFLNILKLYKENGNLNDLDNYDFIFIGEENVIFNRKVSHRNALA